MDDLKYATIDFDGEVHHALRLKAAASNCSISAMMDEAVRITLAEDADDLRDADPRQAEPSTNFEDFLANPRDRGRLSSYHKTIIRQGTAGLIRPRGSDSLDRDDTSTGN